MTASSIRRLVALVVLLIGIGTKVGAQPSQAFTRIWFGDGSAATPSITFVSDVDTGLYRIGANNIGVSTGGALAWDANTTRVKSSLLFQAPTISLGNNTPALTSPTRYFQFSDTRAAAFGSTQYWGGSIETYFNSSNASTNTGLLGTIVATGALGTQNYNEIHSLEVGQSSTTTGTVAKEEAIRGFVNRSGGNTTEANGLTTYATIANGNIATNYGAKIYTPTIGSGGSITNNYGLVIEKQDVATSNVNVSAQINFPPSQAFRMWADGSTDYELTTSTPFKSGYGDGYIKNFNSWNWTGGDPGSATPIRLNYSSLLLNPTEDTTGYNQSIVGEAHVLGTHNVYNAVATTGYAEINGDAGLTNADNFSFLTGLDGEFGHYSTATITAPLLGGYFAGGVGSGTANKAWNVWLDSLWDTTGTTVERVALNISPVFEGSTSNWAIRYTTQGSQVAGLTGGGSFVDAPGTISGGATFTLTPTTSMVKLTCTDGGGCAVTMGESGIEDGQQVRIINVSANTANFSDTSGTSELAGSFAMGQWDSLTLQYVTDRWVEISRSNN